jgi:hypothetical protein
MGAPISRGAPEDLSNPVETEPAARVDQAEVEVKNIAEEITDVRVVQNRGGGRPPCELEDPPKLSHFTRPRRDPSGTHIGGFLPRRAHSPVKRSVPLIGCNVGRTMVSPVTSKRGPHAHAQEAHPLLGSVPTVSRQIGSREAAGGLATNAQAG